MAENPEPIPGVLGVNWEFILDVTTEYTPSHNLESVPPTSTFLDSRSKQENPDETHTDAARTRETQSWRFFVLQLFCCCFLSAAVHTRIRLGFFFFWLYPHPRWQAWFISHLISLHDLSQLSAHLTVMIISEQLILNVLRPHSGFAIMRAIIQDHVARPCYLGVREVERVISFGHTVTLHFCHILPNVSSCYWSKQWKHVAS